MVFLRVLVISTLIILTIAEFTKIVKRNVYLSRKKRYLAFPEKSNLVITMSFSKPLLQVQPRGHNLVGECDVPFALPAGARPFKQLKRNHLQKREILSQIEMALSQNGLNGSACVKRMICEAQQYSDVGGKSLVKDFLSAIFISPEMDLITEYKDSCHDTTFIECSISLFNYIVGIFAPT